MQHTDDSIVHDAVDDVMAALERYPELKALYVRQPHAVQQAYLDWWHSRHETRAAHRDCIEAFLGGYSAGWAGKRRRAA